MDLGEVDYFGSARTPEMTVGQLVRIGIALPLFIEAVDVRGHLYVDGGIIDLFPAEPVIADPSIDRAFGINVMLPRRFQAENVTGWQTHRMGVLRESRQLQQGYHLELARRSQRQLGERLTLIDPIDSKLLRGVSFYDLFIDRRRWPELIRQGYLVTRRALRAFGADAGRMRGTRPRTAAGRRLLRGAASLDGLNGVSRDDQHGPIGDVQQLVGDAAEQRADTAEAAGADDDLIGVLNPGDVGDRLGRRAADQLCLVLGLEQLVVAGQRHRVQQRPPVVLAVRQEPLEVWRAQEVRGQLVGVHDEHDAVASCTPSGHRHRGARCLRAVVADDDHRSALRGHADREATRRQPRVLSAKRAAARRGGDVCPPGQ
jgi:hypothetical protein